MNVKDFFIRILAKKKKWQGADAIERIERQLRWMRARHEVSQYPHFIEWLESMMIDYFQMAKQIPYSDPKSSPMKIYYDGCYDAVEFIIRQIENSTDERIKMESRNLEEKQKEKLTE